MCFHNESIEEFNVAKFQNRAPFLQTELYFSKIFLKEEILLKDKQQNQDND